MSESRCFSIEYEEPKIETCSCCGAKIFRLTRFICKHGDAFAICYALFTEKHLPIEVNFAVSIGEWGDDADPASRHCFTVRYHCSSEARGFMVQDASDNKWAHASILGRFLNRDEALADKEVENLWAILDTIYLEDPVLGPYIQGLGGSTGAEQVVAP
jgi:hypothetical protein